MLAEYLHGGFALLMHAKHTTYIFMDMSGFCIQTNPRRFATVRRTQMSAPRPDRPRYRKWP